MLLCESACVVCLNMHLCLCLSLSDPFPTMLSGLARMHEILIMLDMNNQNPYL